MAGKIIFTLSGATPTNAKIYRIQATEQNQFPYNNSQNQFHDINFPLVNGENFIGNYVAMPLYLKNPETGDNLTIPEAVVTVNKRKNIVSTEIIGGYGTVKEYINDGDMELSITVGIVAVDDSDNLIDRYPTSELITLQNILDAKNTIYITSDFLKIFGIDSEIFGVVITDYSVVQSTHSNHQVIEINAVSDYDYVIFEEEN